MQIIRGYSDIPARSNLLNFRLFHLDNPHIKKWRGIRHGRPYQLDLADNLAISLSNGNIVAVDCAGWYLEHFNTNVQCFESSSISKLYYPLCFVEPDLFVHKPTYANDHLVLVKFPHFLKYSSIDNFVSFLELWCSNKMILNFSEIHIQHNHLKYNLLDIIKVKTNLMIEKVQPNLWVITK